MTANTLPAAGAWLGPTYKGDLYVDGTLTVGTALEEGTTAKAARLVSLTATATITDATHEGKILLMTEAGGNASCTFTLPAATGTGGRYLFVVNEVNTSNYVIKAVAGADVFRGTILGASTTDSATDEARTWASGATDDTLTLNGTTTGGVKRGDWVELIDVATDMWFVRGFITQSGTEATPFSDSVA